MMPHGSAMWLKPERTNHDQEMWDTGRQEDEEHDGRHEWHEFVRKRGGVSPKRSPTGPGVCFPGLGCSGLLKRTA